MRTEINPSELTDNVIKLLSKDWMLVSAGNSENYNTMTASWGGIGFMWNKPVAFVVIRPERYTHEFTEKNDYMTLSFFTEAYRDALTLLGTRSGRDGNKIAESGLTPEFTSLGNPTFTEARIVMECKKLFKTSLEGQDFIDKSLLEKWYTTKGNLHELYIVEIESIRIT